MKKLYEVAIYNQDVRDCVNDSKVHPRFEDSWADTHLIEISAHDAEEAKKIALRRHPEKAGFVIGNILEA
ncbi:MAG: hypothetical protein CMF31_04675 [Kordiimonas sp.]|nr:hypothetical protein [Kordiimonas sp.]|tara:strand:- start:1660 stop:1869 length:210 start_codon:yes stop_codon:yes gene_type:complete